VERAKNRSTRCGTASSRSRFHRVGYSASAQCWRVNIIAPPSTMALRAAAARVFQRRIFAALKYRHRAIARILNAPAGWRASRRRRRKNNRGIMADRFMARHIIGLRAKICGHRAQDNIGASSLCLPAISRRVTRLPAARSFAARFQHGTARVSWLSIIIGSTTPFIR